MKIIKDEYGYIFKDEDVSDAADATAFAVAHIKKPITIADRLRAMTEEELAEFFKDTTFCDSCFIFQNECGVEKYSCKQRWLDWLRQEAPSDNH